jgi:hypothetical protein
MLGEKQIVKLLTFGLVALSAASVEKANAALVTLTVNTDTDAPTLYPGGETVSSGGSGSEGGGGGDGCRRRPFYRQRQCKSSQR